jgi:nitric oxide reductase NorD protein
MAAVESRPTAREPAVAAPQDWERMRSQLTPYLRSLWNIAPALLETPAANAPLRPFLSPLGVHLPNLRAQPHAADWYQAAAAHAAAHLVFSNHRFDIAGLPAITQALLGLLEDARVEWLACRELPGLRRLWRSFHETPELPLPDFEGLMRRLARCLLDPSHADPHPWVQKGVRLFFLDDAGEVLALRQPDALRHAASLLGHDIGQSRMPFNPRQYAVAPSYRDDNSWLWETTEQQPEAPTEVSAADDETADRAPPPQQIPLAPVAAQPELLRYREWDRQVPMYRADWCAVAERSAALAEPAGDESAEHADLLQRLQRAARSASPSPRRIRLTRQADGDDFDLDALVQAWTERRVGSAMDMRVHQRVHSSGRAPTTLLLLDTSASTAQAAADGSRSVLAMTRLSALLCGLALQGAGRAHAIHAFSSEGRHAVHYERVKDFDETLGTTGVRRLMGLRSRFSTRLGAALRHATHRLSLQPGPRRILLITDGEPHDVDVHDPKYLVEDARQAVREAMRRGIGVFCLNLNRAAERCAHRIFGRRSVLTLSDLDGLPAALTRTALSG